jgi:hypothetical protein
MHFQCPILSQYSTACLVLAHAKQCSDMNHTSCPMSGFIPELIHDSFNIFQFILEVLVTDDSWITCNITQYFLEFLKFDSMFISCTLYQVVAGRTVYTPTLSVILVLLATITLATFHILQTLGTKSTLYKTLITLRLKTQFDHMHTLSAEKKSLLQNKMLLQCKVHNINLIFKWYIPFSRTMSRQLSHHSVTITSVVDKMQLSNSTGLVIAGRNATNII